MKKLFLNLTPVLIIGFLFSAFSLFSQNSSTSHIFQYSNKELNTITTAIPFLMIAPDARAGGLGDAGVASTPDANSIHWNPAKLAFIQKDIGFSVSYSPWLRALVNDINLAYLSGYKKFGKDQAIAASLLYFSLGDITFTDIVGNTIGQFRPSEFAVDVCYSRKLSEKFSGGVSLRYIHSNLTGGYFVGGAESHPGNSIATDVSTYYETEFDLGQTPSKLGLGLNISNIGSKISYTETTERDFIPINLRIGPALTLDLDDYNQIAVMLDINKLLVPTPPVYDSVGGILAGKDPDVSVVSGMFQSFGDAPGGFKEEMREFTISTGVEYWYDKQFAIRAGFFYEDKTKGNRKFFTLGAGLKYNVFGLDFAYLIPIEQRNPLENTLRFTLLFDFDAFKDQNKTE
ncbi:MAG: type IX secretion system outer membrane channel protein PorV [Bacteroidota bacterium]